ncbi:hypothetical protein DACRYDRAFT_109907 [Dacryopinax primogenitus]|uniref:Uncharacterized protein n=1 Tax=Dacryopinax primogenitus (strain DJM 731) TaxID=1858805 RepID=M5G056_DACPD|nr:uncharacterized protein DACRYDRAFT_109907 [Dacryopinax primogenitus]EJT99181.1 hypothetical protein DACRYDRAFT_109907 [Dacryopinax primogenitus]
MNDESHLQWIERVTTDEDPSTSPTEALMRLDLRILKTTHTESVSSWNTFRPLRPGENVCAVNIIPCDTVSVLEDETTFGDKLFRRQSHESRREDELKRAMRELNAVDNEGNEVLLVSRGSEVSRVPIHPTSESFDLPPRDAPPLPHRLGVGM